MSIIAVVLGLIIILNEACDVFLSQSDFLLGTYRIISSGIYCLSEDITFDPKSGTISNPNVEGAWFPGFTDPAFGFGENDTSNPSLGTTTIAPKLGAFSLGFFAAITIEANDVVLNLNGYTIRQSRAFYIQQRFFALIEIGNSPFFAPQGPNGQFGELSPVNNIVIKNGCLGLSSHHGIHSNDAKNVVISNLKIKDFEVGGIQLNGFDGAIINNVVVGPSATEVFVNSFYSGARFVLQQYFSLRANDPTIDDYIVKFANGRSLKIKRIINRLTKSMDIIFRRALGVETMIDKSSPLRAGAINMFENLNGGIPDGSAIYGVLLNSKGVAVNGFGDSSNLPGQGNDLIIESLVVKDLKMSTLEVLGVHFSTCDNDPTNDQTAIKATIGNGPFGEILVIEKMIQLSKQNVFFDGGNTNNLRYRGNVLSDAQFGLYLFAINNGGDTFGASIPAELLSWVTDINNTPLPTCVGFVCNADIMFHTNKGAVAVRIDGIENVMLKTITVSNIENKGPIGAKICGNYSDGLDGGNIFQLPDEGNMQTDVRGFSVIGSEISIFGDTLIRKLDSHFGDVFGIDFLGTNEVYIDNAPVVRQISPASEVTGALLQELIDENLTPFPNRFDGAFVRSTPNTDTKDFDLSTIGPTPTSALTDMSAHEMIQNVMQGIHNYELYYIVPSILFGILLAYMCWCIVCRKRNQKQPYLKIDTNTDTGSVSDTSAVNI